MIAKPMIVAISGVNVGSWLGFSVGVGVTDWPDVSGFGSVKNGTNVTLPKVESSSKSWID
jgi:hypothetical protein